MSSKNLLVVDDSATTRMLISLTLKKEGTYNITEVANGKEAVDKLGDESVDCVLTDINMPQMNGLDLIAYIRAKHSEPKVPIIVRVSEISMRVVGVVVIYKLLSHKKVFSPIDHQILELVAAHAASALVSARLHSSMDRKLKTIEGFVQLMKSR